MPTALICFLLNQRPFIPPLAFEAPSSSAKWKSINPADSRNTVLLITSPNFAISSVTSSLRSSKNSGSSLASSLSGSKRLLMRTKQLRTPAGAASPPAAAPGMPGTPPMPIIMFGIIMFGIVLGSIPGIPGIPGIPIKLGSRLGSALGMAGIMPTPAAVGGGSAIRLTMMRLPTSSRPLSASCAALASSGFTNVMLAMPRDTPVSGLLGIVISEISPNGSNTSDTSCCVMFGCSSLTTSFDGSAVAPVALPPIIALAAATFFACCASRFFSAIEACTSSGCPLKAMPLSASALSTDCASKNST
mmetsp:Transcript_21050/g.42685  ORF Transcript_21050/g.42685 Transcript_21050/m.42685 type:complete len:303 (-) Transcript_21050:507-1415(-)